MLATLYLGNMMKYQELVIPGVEKVRVLMVPPGVGGKELREGSLDARRPGCRRHLL